MYVPPSHVAALQEQAQSGTVSEQQAAKAALQQINQPVNPKTITQEQAKAIYESSTGTTEGFQYSSTGDLQKSHQTPKQQHIQALINQASTGSENESRWAVEALQNQGYIVQMPEKQALTNIRFAELEKYETPLPDTFITEDQARALYERSGGQAKDFYYKPPKMYDTITLANDINAGRQTDITKQDYEAMFGEGSFRQALSSTKGLKQLQNGEWVDYNWYNHLPADEKKWVSRYGIDGYIEQFFLTDPITNIQYRKSDIADKWGLQSNGQWTGEIDWKQLNYDMAASDTWKALEKGKIVNTNNERITDIATKYNYSAPATNAINDVLKEYRDLPKEARLIISGKKYQGVKGSEGLQKWVADQNKKAAEAQAKIEISSKAVAPIFDKKGNIDIIKLASLTQGDTNKEKQVIRHLNTMGYSGIDALNLVKEAGKIKKYKYNPDSFTDYLHQSATEEGTARGMAMDILPFVSSYRSIEKRGYKSGWTIANLAGDAVIVIPAIRGVSLSVKAGQPLSRAILNEAKIAVRGEIMGPIDLMLHPKQAVQAITAPFASFIPFRKTLPIASVYRGTYGPMSISKVPAGASPMVIRKAMEEAQQAMIAGKKSGSVSVEGGGQLHYSSAGLQKELPGTVITSTPHGMSFQDTGLVARGEGIYTGDSAYLGLAHKTAYGDTVMYGFKGKDFKGVISGNKLLNDHGRVIGQVQEVRARVYNPELNQWEYKNVIKPGAKIFGENGKVIARVKEQPSFVLIQTNGMQTLPGWAEGIDDIHDLEYTAWKHFETGKYGNELYPVFKQYSHWIEKEGLLPKGTHMIPVLDNKGNQVILRTRGAMGEVISMPMMQLVDKKWLETVRETTKELGPVLDLMKPKMSVEKMLSKVTDIPNAKKTAPIIAEWFRKNPDVRMVGSTVEYIHTGKYVPHDIDMGATNPIEAAKSLAKDIEGKTGINIKVAKNKDGTARLEWIDKDGLRIEMANIRHLDDTYETKLIDGVRLETPAAQLQRTLKRMESEFAGKGYVRFERYLRSAGQKVDIGIGAKAPSILDIERLRLRGWRNTVSDIFNKDLRLDKRLEAARKLSPYIEDDVSEMARAEKQISELLEEQRKLDKLRIRDKNTPMPRSTESAASASATMNELKRIKSELEKAQSTQQKIEQNLRDDIRRLDYIDRQVFTGYTGLLRTTYNQQAEVMSDTGRRRRPIEAEPDIERTTRPEVERSADRDRDLPNIRRSIEPGRDRESSERSGRDTRNETSTTRSGRIPEDTPPPRRPGPRRYRDGKDRFSTDYDSRIERRGRRDEDEIKRKDTPKPDIGGDDKEKDRKGKAGVVAWRQGEITEDGQRKSVFVVASFDGSMENRGTGNVKVVTKRPEGVPETGSPQETLTILGGKPPKRMKVRTGALVATIENGSTIRFNKPGKRQKKIVRGKQPRIIRPRNG